MRRLATIHTFGDSWPRSGLDDRSRALISVTIAATFGTYEPLRGQLRIALNSGMTKGEIVELFIHLAAYAGAARAFDSYQIALAVFAEASSRAAGILPAASVRAAPSARSADRRSGCGSAPRPGPSRRHRRAPSCRWWRYRLSS